MLKKIVVVCCLVVLLSTAAVADPGKGKFVITAPMISATGLFALGSVGDNYSFGDDGLISVVGTSQGKVGITDEATFMLYSAPWLLGYFVTDKLEVGLNIGYYNPMDGSDSIVNLGLYAAYYLSTGKLMPFVKVGLIQLDITDDSDTMINSSIGVAYALSKTVAPYLSLDFNTLVDTGTMVDLTLGLKFMF